MVATVVGTLETFDYGAYANKLADLVGVSADKIKVTAKVAGTRLRRSLQDGSLEVTSEIRAQNTEVANAVKNVINTQTPATLGQALGATVTSFTPAVVTSAVVDTASPNPPPPALNQSLSLDDSVAAQTAESGTATLGGGAIAGIVIVAVLLLVSILFIVYMINREKKGTPVFQSIGGKVPAVVSVNRADVSCTSATTDSALEAHDKI